MKFASYAACLLASSLTFVAPVGAQSLESWGTDLWSQLSTPPPVAFDQIVGGGAHSVGLALDGSVHTWGASFKPVVGGSPAGNDFIQIASGIDHAVALRADGSLASWGEDDNGQYSGTPAGTGFIHVAAGGDFSLALRADGSIVGWGEDTYGQVSAAPTGTGFVELTCGFAHGVARHTDGSLEAWGADFQGQVSGKPSGTGFKRIEAGGNHTLSLRTDGSIQGWGDNGYGLVSGAPGGTGYQDIAADLYTDMALAADGSVVAWGSDYYGVVGGVPTGTVYHEVAISTGVGMALTWDCNGNGVDDLVDISAGTSTDFDGNLLPDECTAPPLFADRFDLSVVSGGVQNFLLDAGEDQELRAYLLLGSTAGTSPGVVFDGQTVPLQLDSYLLHTLTRPNNPPLTGSLGVLSASSPGPGGLATASLTLPPALDPVLVGLTLHHAYVVLDVASAQVHFVSNPVPTVLLP